MSQKIKTLRSHAALARYNAQLGRELGWTPQPAEVKTPYSFGATRMVWEREGKAVVVYEVAHRRYEVHEIPAAAIYATEDAAFAACEMGGAR